MNRGRFQRGNRRAAHLSPEMVLWIREKYNGPERWTQGRLARETGRSVGQIGRIVRNECWQDVEQILTDRQVAYERLKAKISPEPEVPFPADALERLLQTEVKTESDEPPTGEDPIERYLRRNK